MKSKTIIQPSRRAFLKGTACTAGFVITGGFSPFSWVTGHPFKLGVASGSSSSQGFVIWTRLAPNPLDDSPDGLAGLKGVPTKVRYEISTDEKMRKIVRKGTTQADPAFGYSVHVELSGLNPARPYWYRFHHGDATSRIGRGMTLPAAGAPLEHLKIAFVSCSNYEQGYFSAYRHLADEQPSGVLFLGDYIYEGIDQHEGNVRVHSDKEEATTLAGYRRRYAQYQTDEDLQRLRAEVSSFVTWDDHEVQNDYAGEWSQTFDDPKLFLKRRAAAYQAYFENMPVKPNLSTPQGPMMRIYDRFAFGDLAEVSMIDGRQYRSRSACYGPPDKGHGHLETVEDCPELLESNRSLVGMAQEQWLFDGLAQSKKKWNIIGNDVLMASFRQKAPTGEFGYWTDDWNGYPASRARLMAHIHQSGVPNPVVVTGDNHAFWASDLKLEPSNAKSPTVATEFVGTSISSRGPSYETFMSHMKENPHVHFFDSRVRGYTTLDITPATMTAKFQTVSDAKDPKATLSTLRTWVVEDGKAGPVSA